jgi:uncharacterized iron-regulated protein
MTLLGALAFALFMSVAPAPAPAAWDTLSRERLGLDELVARLTASDLVILGEIHDNAEHHRLQNAILQALIARGRRPALAMEQFDREHQAALDAALAAPGATPDSVAEAGRFDRRGWDWPAYRPLLETALAHRLPLVAANLSRRDARVLVSAGPAGLGALAEPELAVRVARASSPALKAAIESDIENGHCGHRFAAPVLAGMVAAQQARDAVMAALSERAALAGGRQGAVLIAGSGHARRDRGVPAYLPKDTDLRVHSLAFRESADPQAAPSPADRDAGPAANPATDPATYDFVWPTLPAKREDPCRAFLKSRTG